MSAIPTSVIGLMRIQVPLFFLTPKPLPDFSPLKKIDHENYQGDDQ